MLAFALTIFTGAFLLFQVQPLIGKYILPWFGGSPGVWTTCMLFFQLLLLGGYAYAHFVSRWLKPRKQVMLHLALLLLALATLPITPADSWKPHTSGDPTWRILALLAASLGLPYMMLATTGPLMQEWFRRTQPGASPYRLYALSNVGSLLALISYPFYFETNFTRRAQAEFWSWGLVIYAICCAYCAYRTWHQPEASAEQQQAADAGAVAPTWLQKSLWIALPACASILLLAVTNKMCQDVAVIPFLWVLPLALYLLSFIISFDSPRWYSRFYYTIALIPAMVAMCWALIEGTDMEIVRQIVIYSAGMFIGCMVCHGELYHLKPHPKYLTSFYLMISAGGAVGGLFVALIAPHIFSNYYETHVSFALVVLLLLVMSFTGREAISPVSWQILFLLLFAAAAYGLDRTAVEGVEWLKNRQVTAPSPSLANVNWEYARQLHWLVWVLAALYLMGGVALRRIRRTAANWHLQTCSLMVIGFIALVAVLMSQIETSVKNSVTSARNFYGVLSVFEYGKGNPDSHYYLLQHGRITHGFQFASTNLAPMITSYFGENSGIGLALRHFPRQQNQRIGLLGLGVGTVTAYGKPGDYIRIYEINPQVKEAAEKQFTYLGISKAKTEVVMGDGRLSMENEPPQNFDFLIMDAFSSDAVPIHLLTKEAFAIYMKHLKPDGCVLINISNRYLNLRPVVENAAKEFGLKAVMVENNDGGDEEDGGGWWLYGASWMILSKNEDFLNQSAIRYRASPPAKNPIDVRLWTDDYASMFKILHGNGE